MQTHPKVIISIPNFNKSADTIECIDSLENIDYPNYEIVLVENGSSDNSAEEFKARYSPNTKITLLINSNNLGFTGGHNLAIKKVISKNPEYFLLLNNDTVVRRDFLTRLINVAESSDEVGIVGPKIYKYGSGDTIFCAGTKTIPYLAQPFLRGNGENDVGQYDKVEEVDYISGTALLIKKDVIKQIGLLDENFFMFFEDWDWCLRARKHGYKSVYVPNATIWHKGSSTIGHRSPLYYYYMTRNRILFARKHNDGLRFLFLFVPYFITYRLLLPVLMLSLSKDIESIKAIIKGMCNVPKST